MRFLLYFSLLILLISCLDNDDTRRDRFFLQGNEALSLKDYQKAIHYFDNAVRIDPDFSLAFNNRGVAKMNDDRAAEAILDYNEAININPRYFEAIGNRAYAYEQVNRFAPSLNDWKALIEVFPDSAFLHQSKAIVLTKSRAYGEAALAFEEVLRLEPQNDEAMVNMGTLRHYQKQDEEAIGWLDRALAVNAENAHAYNTRNQIQLDNQDQVGAMASITKALELEPGNPYFLNNRGMTWLEMDSLALGIADINRSILLDGANMWAYRNKGIYNLKKGDANTAIRYLEQVRDSRSFVENVQGYLGEAYFQNGDRVQACQAWKLGIEAGDVMAQQRFNEKCGS